MEFEIEKGLKVYTETDSTQDQVTVFLRKSGRKKPEQLFAFKNGTFKTTEVKIRKTYFGCAGRLVLPLGSRYFYIAKDKSGTCVSSITAAENFEISDSARYRLIKELESM